MSPEQHAQKARRIVRSMNKLAEADYEMVIEAAMLAGTHYLNALLHHSGLTPPDEDVMHAEYMTVALRAKTSLIAGPIVEALQAIEEMRPFYVRGDRPEGESAACASLDLLEFLKAKADFLPSRPGGRAEARSY